MSENNVLEIGSFSTSTSITSSNSAISSIISSSQHTTSTSSSSFSITSPTSSISSTAISPSGTWPSTLDPLTPSSQNSDRNPLTSTALASLAKSLPTYLAVGGSILGILILLALGSWYLRRRRRRNRFGTDEDDEEGWRVMRSRRSESRADGCMKELDGKGDLEKGCDLEKWVEDGAKRNEGGYTPELRYLKQDTFTNPSTKVDNGEISEIKCHSINHQSPNLDLSIEQIDTPSNSPISSPISSRRGSQEHLVRK